VTSQPKIVLHGEQTPANHRPAKSMLAMFQDAKGGHRGKYFVLVLRM
jgi:hypothetical protein